MRENRPYGSEGGEVNTLPDPYRLWLVARNRANHALPRRYALSLCISASETSKLA
jgi:hypothetical protein